MSSARKHDSIVVPASQPSPPNEGGDTSAANPTGRYGTTIGRQGYTAVPNTLLLHYRALGIGEAELIFLLQLLQHWWDTAFPYPALGTVAARMGKTIRQVQYYVERLRAAGLVEVLVRRDSQGGQLSNGYDLRPLVQALETHLQGLPAVSDPQALDPAHASLLEADRMQRVACSPTQPTAGEGVQRVAPKVISDSDLDSDSITPQSPRGEPMVPAAGNEGGVQQPHDTSLNNADGPLAMVLRQIGREFGDCAPRSSLTRARRMLARSGLPCPVALEILRHARTTILDTHPAITCRDAAGQPNAMPYFFAVLESLLRDATAAPASRRCRAPSSLGGAAHGHRGERPSMLPSPPPRVDDSAVPDPGEALPDEPPIWRALLAEIAGSVAQSVYRRWFDPLRAQLTGDTLQVIAPSVFHCQWLEVRMRPRLEALLAELGRQDLRLCLALASTSGTGAINGGIRSDSDRRLDT